MFSYRNMLVLSRLLRLPCSRLVTSAHGLRRVVAFFTVLFQLFGALLFDWPTQPDGPDLDMGKFELVWADEFDGTSLDKSIWSGHYIWQGEGYQRDTSWWDMEHVKIENGNLVILAEYKDGGPSATGYYASAIDTSPANQYYGGALCLGHRYKPRKPVLRRRGLRTALWILRNTLQVPHG